MSAVTIYHNPRCSKSRQTLALLEERGITPTVIEYLKTPPSGDELRGLLTKLGISANALLRTKEEDYKRLDLANPDKTEADIINAMTQAPILIERPIVVNGNAARIGRPPEQVLEILD